MQDFNSYDAILLQGGKADIERLGTELFLQAPGGRQPRNTNVQFCIGAWDFFAKPINSKKSNNIYAFLESSDRDDVDEFVRQAGRFIIISPSFSLSSQDKKENWLSTVYLSIYNSPDWYNENSNADMEQFMRSMGKRLHTNLPVNVNNLIEAYNGFVWSFYESKKRQILECSVASTFAYARSYLLYLFLAVPFYIFLIIFYKSSLFLNTF